MMPVFASCVHELCYNHYPTLAMNFSWEREWERDYGMSHPASWDAAHYGMSYDFLAPEMPEWVRVIKYEEEAETPVEHFFSTEGGELILDRNETGSFLLYNGDTEYIVLSDLASLSSARASATARSRSTSAFMAERHGDVRSTNPPDPLYSAYVEKVPHVEFHEVYQMPVKMQPLVYTYLVRYEFEQGLEYVALARGALGGMAESVYLRSGATSDETTIILYDCSLESYGCQAIVRSFGIPGFPDQYYGRTTSQPSDRPYSLNLEVMLRNGKVKEFTYDISDQLAKQPRGGVITVSGIRIEEEEAKVESGFDAEVDDWGDGIEIDLPVATEDDKAKTKLKNK